MSGFFRWGTADDVTLALRLFDPATGLGLTGKTPEVSIRRYWEVRGAALDNYFWNEVDFQAAANWITMSEEDATDSPGTYTYQFEQTLVDESWIYLVYYRHTVAPVGFDVETHVITNEVYVPIASGIVPAGDGTVLGKLALMEDPTKLVAVANAEAADTKLTAEHGAGNWDGSGFGWDAAEREQMRDALGIDGDKTTATGGQLQSLNTYIRTKLLTLAKFIGLK